MRFKIVGADKESGDDVNLTLDASSQADVEQIAHDKGILVSAITAISIAGPAAIPHRPAKDLEAISLVEDEPAPAATNGNGAAHKHGSITVNANNPGDTAHTAEGHIPEVKGAEAAMEYHILMNQALYLLETAVNKHGLKLANGVKPYREFTETRFGCTSSSI